MDVARNGADLASDEDGTLFVEFLVRQWRLPSTVVHFIESGGEYAAQVAEIFLPFLWSIEPCHNL